MVINVFEGTALAAAAWNQPEEAARLLGAAEALTDQSGARTMIATDRAARQRALEAVQASLGGARFRAAWSDGRQLTMNRAIADVQAIVPLEAAADQARAQSAIKLSPREEDVLGLLVTGISDREMADALFLGVRTVEVHVSRIRAKLGVRTRTAAVAAALAAGLVNPAPPPSD